MINGGDIRYLFQIIELSYFLTNIKRHIAIILYMKIKIIIHICVK